jgi:hypothetical protein
VSEELSSGMSALRRRGFLGLGLLAGGTALGALAAPSAAAAPGVPGPTTGGGSTLPPGLNAFAQNDLNFNAQFAFGESGYGASEVGEVAATVDVINGPGGFDPATTGASHQTFTDGFRALGDKLAQRAAAAAAAGHAATARASHLRAASYYNQALFFVLGTSRPADEEAVYQAMQAQWAAFVALSGTRWERVGITMANGTVMPAYFVAAPADVPAEGTGSTGRRPTVIVCNGSDAQFVDVYAYGLAAAVERGWNAIVFEGPGQGSLLFEHRIPFTPDWGSVITPIVDHLLTRPEVDPARIALTGWSFGGNLVVRAAAVEHRLAAVVADPAVLDMVAIYRQELPEVFGPGVADPNAVWQQEIIPYLNSPAGANTKFTFAKRSEIFSAGLLADARAGRVFTDVEAFIALLDSYKLTPQLCAAVTAPVLLIQYPNDSFFVGQLAQVKVLLTASPQVDSYTFQVSDGAEFHCAPMAPQFRNEVVYDWLSAVFAAAPVPPSPTPTTSAVRPSSSTPSTTAAVPTTPATPTTSSSLANTGAGGDPTSMALAGISMIGAGAATVATAAKLRKSSAGNHR